MVQFKVVKRDASKVPKGWRIATCAEFNENRRDIITNILEGYQVAALSDGKCEGKGYGGHARQGVRVDDIREILICDLGGEEDDVATRIGTSRGRSRSPGGWNNRAGSPGRGYSPSRERVDRITSASTRVTSPSREENDKRKKYREEQMQRSAKFAEEEARRNKKLEEERMAADHVRLEAKRAAIRDRIARQMEIAQKLAAEGKADVPFHERHAREAEERLAKIEAEKKAYYDEHVGRYKRASVTALRSGEVKVSAPPKLEPLESPSRVPSASVRRPSASPKRGRSTSPGRYTAPEPPALNPRPVVGRKEKAQAVKAAHHEKTLDEDAGDSSHKSHGGPVLYSTGSRGANQTVSQDEKWAEETHKEETIVEVAVETASDLLGLNHKEEHHHAHKEAEPIPSKKVDWAGFMAKLPPVDGSAESKDKRSKVFDSFDMNGNGYLSLAELDKGIIESLSLHEQFEVPKPVTMRAFQAAKNAHKSKGKQSKGDDYVERSEFRLFFVWIRQYYELWQMFDLMDSGDDRRVDFNEFSACIPKLKEWGLTVTDPEASFAEVDQNGGGQVLFDEFAHWALTKHLDEKADDDFDDVALHGEAPPTIEEAMKEEHHHAHKEAEPIPSKKVDWAGFMAKLPPVDGSAESKDKRSKVFDSFDMNGNGYLSLAELDKGIIESLSLHEQFEVPKPVTMRAFQAAKNAHKSKGKQSKGDDYVERSEFRLFFVWIRQYYELWQMFDLMDSGDDRRVDFNEFSACIPKLKEWGLTVTDPEASFAEVDQNGGGQVLFDEFAHWALTKHLDEKADDDFDDVALHGEAPPTIEEAAAE